MRRLLEVLAFGLALLATGCAYPQRSTPLTPVDEPRDTLSAPPDIHRLTILAAEVPPRRRGELAWDEGGGAPDPQVLLYRDGELVWKTETQQDTTTPRFDETMPNNLLLGKHEDFRIELRDQDDVASDPIGVWRGRGLPSNALPDAEARVMLDSGATVVMRVDPPRPHRGSGISKYEVRDDALIVLEVIERSPAGRAGIEAGDRIVAIEGKAVSALGSSKAASELALAGNRRGAEITVEREDGERVQARLDGGYVWLVM